MPALLDRDSLEALDLMVELGVGPPANLVYVNLLQQSALTPERLVEMTGLKGQSVESALTYLEILLLISRDVVFGETTYYTSNPQNAWKSHDANFYWMRSLHVGDIEAMPPLPAMEDELRRRRYARLERLCGTIYDRSAKAHDPLRHRHRDIGSPQLFVSWLAQTIASASQNIIAVERPPRLPELAPIWVALTRRLREGVTYTRVVGVDEVLEHGLDIVDRDMAEYGIDLRIIPRKFLNEAYYVVDGKRLLLKNTRATSREGREPPFGVYTSQHHIVRRHTKRFLGHYLPLSEPAAPIVQRLRAYGEEKVRRLRNDGRHDEASVLDEVVRLGKFAPKRAENDSVVARLGKAKHLMKSTDGYLVMTPPRSGDSKPIEL